MAAMGRQSLHRGNHLRADEGAFFSLVRRRARSRSAFELRRAVRPRYPHDRRLRCAEAEKSKTAKGKTAAAGPSPERGATPRRRRCSQSRLSRQFLQHGAPMGGIRHQPPDLGTPRQTNAGSRDDSRLRFDFACRLKRLAIFQIPASRFCATCSRFRAFRLLAGRSEPGLHRLAQAILRPIAHPRHITIGPDQDCGGRRDRTDRRQLPWPLIAGVNRPDPA